MCGRRNAERHADKQADRHRVEHKEDRRLKMGGNHLRHRLAVIDGISEVSPQHLGGPAYKLYRQGLVYSQFCLHTGYFVRRRLFAEHHQRRVAGDHSYEDEHQNGDYDKRRQRREQPADRIINHSLSPPRQTVRRTYYLISARRICEYSFSHGLQQQRSIVRLSRSYIKEATVCHILYGSVEPVPECGCEQTDSG
ncbi:hypothetical protein SDC9_193221 [bioreactor metagenome]|uniref:Uncharacterized protein n=1 Tax=bioreactor metagenome TaxID=1076179 RepID=A0A645I4G2_9ZZZZ